MAILRKNGVIGVCVHHSVYKPAHNIEELKAQAKLFDGWHKSKSWANEIKTNGEFGYQYIEYHYLMALDGSILQVQDEKYVLYHAGDNFRGDLSFNLHGIAICLTGNYENDVPTEAQMKSLVLFIRDVEKRYGIDALVRGHKETSKDPTACPGKNIGTSKSGWLSQVIKNVNDKNYPPTVIPPTTPPSAPNCDEYIKQANILKEENKGLTEALGSFQRTLESKEAELKTVNDRVKFLEDTLLQREKELKSLDEDYTRVLDERMRFEKQYMETVTELNELKKQEKDNLLNKLVHFLHNLLGGK